MLQKLVGMPVGNVNTLVDRVSSKRHCQLNTFEMVGFLGCKADFELVLYLGRFVNLLEKVIFHPLDGKRLARILESSSWKQQAKLPGNQLPAKVQLQIL